MTAGKTATAFCHGGLAMLAVLAVLDRRETAKAAKTTTPPPLDGWRPSTATGALPDVDAVTLAYALGWSPRHLARAFGLSHRAIGILAEDDNLADVVQGHLERDPDVLRDYIGGLAERAGGWDAMVTLSAWKPYRVARRADEDDEPPEMPWR
jgi:hypothetical protein